MSIINSNFAPMKRNRKGEGKLTLVPEGGIANRMRAIASGYNLCRTTGSELEVVWFKDHGMNAHFYEIFEPIADLPNIRTARDVDNLLNSRPRRHNLWIPSVTQPLFFQSRIQCNAIPSLKRQGFDFEKWQRGRRNFMSCYDWFGTFPPQLYAELFHPRREAMRMVENNVKHFTPHTIGMHIRRTDNVMAIRQSPTSLFIDAGRSELERHDDLAIFLATDSDEVKQEMRNAFGNQRIITAEATASRDSLAGIIGGIADLWTLSRTNKIYGSSYSSFSDMASCLGGKELIIVQR